VLDISGIFLLIIAWMGIILDFVKGLDLPLWIPLGVTIAALFLLLYQGMWKHSRLTFIHAATAWVALTWTVGTVLETVVGKGLLTQIPIWALLLVTPLAAIAPQQAQKRFSSETAGKKLELTHTDTSPLKEWWELNFLQHKPTASPKKSIKLIVFDLGEEINYENK